MKEHIHTAPVNEAFAAGDECPFCYLERQAEQHALRFTAGPSASYMAPDIRAETNRAGFCAVHMKKLYDFGNALGNALMLQTHFEDVLEQFDREMAREGKPAKKSLFGKKKEEGASRGTWLRDRVGSCYVCEKIDYTMDRYWRTFFYMLKEPEFRQKVEQSKGFCLRHFAQMLDLADEKLPASQQEWFDKTVIPMTRENLQRVKEDLDWLVAKYDYRNADADWRNSKDALQRSMQKVAGIYPADPPYKNE
jgi:hypothetical protein